MGEKEHREKEHRDKEKQGRGKEELEFSATVRGAQAAEYLNRIADGLREGALTLTVSGQTLHLQPAETLRLEMEGESRPDKGTANLHLGLSWKVAHPVRESEEETLVIETEPREPQPAMSWPKSKDS